MLYFVIHARILIHCDTLIFFLFLLILFYIHLIILRYHTASVCGLVEESLMKIARGTPGFSGAELENLVNQASLKASRDHEDVITLTTLEWAKDKILMGK